MTSTFLRGIDNNQDCIACFAGMRELLGNLAGQEAFVAQIWQR